MIELVGRLRFEPGQKRQNFFQLIEPLPFGQVLSMFRDDGIDFALRALLSGSQWIKFRLRHDHLFVRPAHRNKLTDERHLQFAVHFFAAVFGRMFLKPARQRINQAEVAVHVFVFN